MQALVDGHALVDAVQAAGVVIALLVFDQRKVIRPVSVDFIRAGKAEGRLRAEVARRHQHVHGAQRVYIEIVVRYGSRLIVRRLRGGVNDKLRPLSFEHLPDRLAIADVDRQMPVALERGAQFLDDRVGGALFPEELPPHVVVDSGNLPAFRRKLAYAFRADQPARSSYESLHSQNPIYYYGRPRRKAQAWAATAI